MQREVRLGVNFILGHQCLHYGHHSCEEQKKKTILKSRPHLYGYFWIRNFFFTDSKISTSTPIRIQIEFARPHVSDAYLDSLKLSGLLWKYWQQSMRRGRYLEYSIHGKGLGSILLRHWIKKVSGYSVHMIPDSWRIQNFPLWRADSKSYGFVCRIHPIRVDEALVDQIKKAFYWSLTNCLA